MRLKKSKRAGHRENTLFISWFCVEKIFRSSSAFIDPNQIARRIYLLDEQLSLQEQ
ncbi:hypothetical protein FDUTEX481_02752 [Tolypothrix sp. PCC 7601]|nr:hypothetical protein FDUTEX481_02752 [Tolypothrix sp. PCC 7601]